MKNSEACDCALNRTLHCRKLLGVVFIYPKINIYNTLKRKRSGRQNDLILHVNLMCCGGTRFPVQAAVAVVSPVVNIGYRQIE